MQEISDVQTIGALIYDGDLATQLLIQISCYNGASVCSVQGVTNKEELTYP